MSKSKVVVDGDSVVVHFKGKFEDGSEFSSKSDGGPLEYTVGKKMVLGGLEKGVIGMVVGENKKVKMTPADAFGEWDEELVKKVSLSKLELEGEPKEGMIIQIFDDKIKGEDADKIINAVITNIDGDVLTIDYNNPLAGKDLTLNIELIEIL